MGPVADESFAGAGAQPGIEIWRVEKLKVVKQNPETHGNFYSGDSYIVLVTKQKQNSPKLEWDLHFWLGKNTSQDEKGVAAYKTVELDDMLGGGPVQHREVQDHESKMFLSYFKSGIRYLEGGVESGFKKVERDKYETRLMQIKGKRNVRVRQVKCDCSSLNQGDVFILDCGLVIYIWNGPSSSKMERIKAIEVAKKINDEERGARAAIKIIEEHWDSDPGFFQALGSQEPIRPGDDGGDDAEFERVLQTSVKLYRVSDASGKLEVTEVGEKPLKRELLDSKDCFILDAGCSGIYAWIGKQCTKNEKNSAWQNATQFLTLRGYAEWTPVTQVVEGGETPLFKQYFSSWAEKDAQTGLGRVHRTERIAKYSEEKFDTTVLHNKVNVKKESTLPDDGTGSVKIWRVENNDLVLQPEDKYGIFYSGDCYIVLYTYTVGNSNVLQYILYFWQGAKSTIDERAASAFFTQRIDDTDLHGAAVQVRVVQGQEPEHFLLIFKGRMVILLGGVNNVVQESDVRMFQVRGTKSVNTKAVQVIPRAASLNSNDVFIIERLDDLFLWNGRGASSEEKAVARNVLRYICPQRKETEVVEIDEGLEPPEFWNILGGPEAYASGASLESAESDMPPRLFQCSNASGRFRVEEIVDFSQEDLCEDDVMILDTFNEIFVWVGVGANEIEKKEALNTAIEYIRTDPAGRSEQSTLILQVKQGFEPTSFTGHFHGWDTEKWSHGKTYEDLLKELGQENVSATSVKEELASYSKKHPYADLVKSIPPKGVDPMCKEMYLSDEEFRQVFGITRDEYLALKDWKRINLKKKANLF